MSASETDSNAAANAEIGVLTGIGKVPGQKISVPQIVGLDRSYSDMAAEPYIGAAPKRHGKCRVCLIA